MEELFLGILTIILIIYGVLAIIDPYEAFLRGRRWEFRYAEPSDMALIVTRIGGILAVIVGVVVIFTQLFR